MHFSYKEAISPLCPSLPVFPSILEKVSPSLPPNSEFYSLPPLLRLCCINNFLWFFFSFFALSIVASPHPSSAYKRAYILLLLKKVSPRHSSGNYFPCLTSPPGESHSCGHFQICIKTPSEDRLLDFAWM